MTAAYLTMLLADSRLPTGAHTQSAGVEPALAAGMSLTDIPAYLRVRLRTVTEVEAACAVVARQRWVEGAYDELAAVDRAWRVRTVSDALRDASDLLGRSYLRMAGSVWDLTALGVRRARPWCRAVVLGAAAGAAGLSGPEVARLVAYDDVQTVIGAALKLIPFDPNHGVRWAVAAADEVEQLVARVEWCTAAEQIPAHSAPLIEQWGQQHRDAERRLFRA